MALSANKKKAIERYYVEDAARHLSEVWQLTPNEAPDFIVDSAGHQFGLEVTEVHIGEQTQSGGSRERAIERANYDWLMGIRREFALHAKSDVWLRYLGPQTDNAKKLILNALIAENFDRKLMSHKLEISFERGMITATKSLRPHWVFVRDRNGWVSQNGMYLNDAIAAKALRLASYKKVCDDIRLLVVANRTANSGKLKLKENFKPELRGFNMVYFLSYPEEVTIFYST